MNVLIVLAGHPRGIGGVERVVSHTTARLSTMGDVDWRVVCAADEERTDAHPNVDALSVSGVGPLFDLRFGRAVRRYLARSTWEPELIHFHLPQARGPLLFNRGRSRGARVLTFHTTAAGKRRKVYAQTPASQLLPRHRIQKHAYSRIEPKLESMAIPGGTQVTTVSDGVRDEVELWYGTDVTRVVPNGIDTESLPATDRGEHMLFVGRLMPQKGIFRLPEILGQADVNVPLKIVGGGPYLHRARQAFAGQDIDADFLVEVSEERLRELYADAAFLLLPSYYEGHPMVALEAACAGLPIVAFEAADVRETVCPANAELLAADGDLDVFADAVSSLLADREYAADVGAANRERILDRYTASRMAAEYVDLYRNAMS